MSSAKDSTDTPVSVRLGRGPSVLLGEGEAAWMGALGPLGPPYPLPGHSVKRTGCVFPCQVSELELYLFDSQHT